MIAIDQNPLNFVQCQFPLILTNLPSIDIRSIGNSENSHFLDSKDDSPAVCKITGDPIANCYSFIYIL